LTENGNPVAYSVPCNGLELTRKSAGSHAHDQSVGPQKEAPEAHVQQITGVGQVPTKARRLLDEIRLVSTVADKAAAVTVQSLRKSVSP
jgi:hypothetical protein